MTQEEHISDLKKSVRPPEGSGLDFLLPLVDRAEGNIHNAINLYQSEPPRKTEDKYGLTDLTTESGEPYIYTAEAISHYLNLSIACLQCVVDNIPNLQTWRALGLVEELKTKLPTLTKKVGAQFSYNSAFLQFYTSVQLEVESRQEALLQEGDTAPWELSMTLVEIDKSWDYLSAIERQIGWWEKYSTISNQIEGDALSVTKAIEGLSAILKPNRSSETEAPELAGPKKKAERQRASIKDYFNGKHLSKCDKFLKTARSLLAETTGDKPVWIVMKAAEEVGFLRYQPTRSMLDNDLRKVNTDYPSKIKNYKILGKGQPLYLKAKEEFTRLLKDKTR